MFDLSLEEFSNDSFFARKDAFTQIVRFGNGISKSVADYAKSLGSHALLVTDPGVRKAGHVDVVSKLMESSGIQVTIYDKSVENPTESSVQRCVEVADSAGIDLILGLGGGSSMDTAKGCNFVLTNGGTMEDYWGIDKATKPMHPLIAIPTTAGTGSECQSFALISKDDTHLKMACGDRKALPRVTLLDPELTLSQPLRVSACTGIDALAHALESAVTKKRSEDSNRHAKIAFQLLNHSLPIIFKDPNDLTARGGAQLGASHAGAAIEKSMLGAAHSMANPLTAKYGTIHGVAVGLALPLVMEFNSTDQTSMNIYSEFAKVAQLSALDESSENACNSLINRVKVLLGMARFQVESEQAGFDSNDIPELASEAAKQWTAGFNPRSIEVNDFEVLYQKLFHSFARELV